VGASVSGVIAHWRRGNVDFLMGFVLLVGGFLGSGLGVWLFAILRPPSARWKLVVTISYVVLLGVLGLLMLIESTRVILRRHRPGAGRPQSCHRHMWIHGLPLKMRSAVPSSTSAPSCRWGWVSWWASSPPSWASAAASSWCPPLIYMLGMPTAVVPGTSLPADHLRRRQRGPCCRR